MFLNFMYVLADEDGELHWPKDNERREIKFGPEQERSIRQKILADARRLVHQGPPLSSGWLRQLNMGPQALQMAAAERSGARPPKLLKAPPPRKRNQWEIEKIVDEWQSSTKATKMYRVRWAGCVSYPPVQHTPSLTSADRLAVATASYRAVGRPVRLLGLCTLVALAPPGY